MKLSAYVFWIDFWWENIANIDGLLTLISKFYIKMYIFYYFWKYFTGVYRLWFTMSIASNLYLAELVSIIE